MMRPERMRTTLLLALGLLLALPATAKEAVPTSTDPALEKRVMSLSAELRCLVCQNQNIADSHSELANDLRQQVREQLSTGKSDQQVIDYMVERYGDFVRYRPPFKATTLLLWVGPAVLFIIGGAVLYTNLSRRRRLIEETPLSEAERQRVQSLLATPPEKDSQP